MSCFPCDLHFSWPCFPLVMMSLYQVLMESSCHSFPTRADAMASHIQGINVMILWNGLARYCSPLQPMLRHRIPEGSSVLAFPTGPDVMASDIQRNHLILLFRFYDELRFSWYCSPLELMSMHQVLKEPPCLAFPTRVDLILFFFICWLLFVTHAYHDTVPH